MKTELHLSIQYASDCQDILPRWRLRNWVQKALDNAVAVYHEAGEEPPFTCAQFALRMVGPEEMTELNGQYRDKAYATNVLTFEYGVDENQRITADIIICDDVLKREAVEQKKTLLQHAAHLTVHGVLHALGYDHIDPEDAEDMESLEIEILQLLKIPNPYLAK
ncbi:rRNA maturation RNase YbeY [Paenalcaligenes sp. Me131]|jgi:probable rRNA maturation factor|uniref:rRNA maturation RNase YbeY n=1 Tax=Paenalcaligenes sp. Me131 TaxID=3392636 RepID=UPI003D29C768